MLLISMSLAASVHKLVSCGPRLRMWLNAVVMNGCLQATSKVEIDPEATEKLQVTMANFRHALLNDVKPVSGILLLELSVHQSVNYRDIIVVQDVTVR